MSRFRTLCRQVILFLEHRLHPVLELGHQVRRVPVADRRVRARAVVEPLDPVDAGHLGRLARLERAPVVHLLLEARPEALRDRVVPAAARAAHREADAVGGGPRGKLGAGVLRAPVRAKPMIFVKPQAKVLIA